MDAIAERVSLKPGFVSLAALPRGACGSVVGVGSGAAALSSLERRLLELGFVHGEQVEVLAEARPGRDPFVVRVGHTTLALRRREAQGIWVELHHSEASASPHAAQTKACERVELQHSEASASPHAAQTKACEQVELHQTKASAKPHVPSVSPQAVAAEP